jgi:hypothetical protein
MLAEALDASYQPGSLEQARAELIALGLAPFQVPISAYVGIAAPASTAHGVHIGRIFIAGRRGCPIARQLVTHPGQRLAVMFPQPADQALPYRAA